MMSIVAYLLVFLSMTVTLHVRESHAQLGVPLSSKPDTKNKDAQPAAGFDFSWKKVSTSGT